MAFNLFFMIENVHADHFAAFTDQSFYFAISKNLCAVFFGIQHIGSGQTKRIHGAVRDDNGADQLRIDGRFKTFGKLGINGNRFDIGRGAGLNEGFLIIQIIFRQRNKQTFAVFNTMAGNSLEDHIFLNTFFRRFLIVYRISRTAVQKPVITSGCAGGNIAPFQ